MVQPGFHLSHEVLYDVLHVGERQKLPRLLKRPSDLMIRYDVYISHSCIRLYSEGFPKEMFFVESGVWLNDELCRSIVEEECGGEECLFEVGDDILTLGPISWQHEACFIYNSHSSHILTLLQEAEIDAHTVTLLSRKIRCMEIGTTVAVCTRAGYPSIITEMIKECVEKICGLHVAFIVDTLGPTFFASSSPMPDLPALPKSDSDSDSSFNPYSRTLDKSSYVRNGDGFTTYLNGNAAATIGGFGIVKGENQIYAVTVHHAFNDPEEGPSKSLQETHGLHRRRLLSADLRFRVCSPAKADRFGEYFRELKDLKWYEEKLERVQKTFDETPEDAWSYRKMKEMEEFEAEKKFAEKSKRELAMTAEALMKPREIGHPILSSGLKAREWGSLKDQMGFSQNGDTDSDKPKPTNTNRQTGNHANSTKMTMDWALIRLFPSTKWSTKFKPPNETGHPDFDKLLAAISYQGGQVVPSAGLFSGEYSGKMVFKNGAGSGMTTGQIYGVLSFVKLRGGVKSEWSEEMTMVETVEQPGRCSIPRGSKCFSEQGDSGAFVYTLDRESIPVERPKGQLVGMVIAGGLEGFKKLNLTFVTSAKALMEDISKTMDGEFIFLPDEERLRGIE